jgi:hypothetical protein
MKKASKPSTAPKSVPKKSSAKPITTTKSATKPKPRKAQGQAELAQVAAQLAMNAEKLAQAAERLTLAAEKLTQGVDRLADATVWNSQRREQQPDTFKTLSESIADVAASEEHPETADPPDLTPSEERAKTTD